MQNLNLRTGSSESHQVAAEGEDEKRKYIFIIPNYGYSLML